MPVLVEPKGETAASLITAMPIGSQTVSNIDGLIGWLTDHEDEYAVVLGPNLPLDEAADACSDLRVASPMTSVVIVRPTLDTQVLTTAMKAGARDVTAVEDLESVSSAIDRAQQLHAALHTPKNGVPVTREGKIVTVFSPKGGVGKTTMSVNLALTLAALPERSVVLVDMDLGFGDVAITTQIFPTHTIEHAIGSEDQMDAEILTGLLTDHSDSLKVLAAPSHPDAIDRITPVLVSRILRTLREMFDYVVVDTAPAFDDGTLTALDETDECVIVATLDVPTLKNVKVALETMNALDIASGHRHLLLNRADDAVGIGVDKVESILGMPVSVHIASSIDIAAGTNSGRPIVVGRPDHASTAAVRDLAQKLTGEKFDTPQSPGAASPKKVGGLFGRRKKER